MKKIAITGNIASGKSQVERILVSLGYKVVDTDKINHSILSSDLNTINLIKDEFKQDDILDEHGNISREKLGKIIFYEHAKKIKLEQILHAKIDELLINFYNENKDKEVWTAKDFQSGKYFVGYEASARMSDLIRLYPELLIVGKDGRFRTLTIDWTKEKEIKEILVCFK